MTTQFHAPVDVAFTGGTYHGPFHIYVGKRPRTAVLSRGEIARMREVYVPHEDSFRKAMEVLKAEAAVVLSAERGNGLRITAVNLAARLESQQEWSIPVTLQPEWLNIDEEDVQASLRSEPRRVYLLDLRECRPADIPVVGRDLTGYVTRLSQVGSYLIVLAGEQELGSLDPDLPLKPVKIERSDALQVFESHLVHTYGLSKSHAQAWAAEKEIQQVLAGAGPQNAVDLAGHVHEAADQAPNPDAVTVILSAYFNWSAAIKNWFASTDKEEDGYYRALLLAIAVYEGAGATEVFRAADALCKNNNITYLPGGGLLGPGISDCLAKAEAHYLEGRVQFTRHRFRTAVLDHVWEDRPFFQGRLTEWLQNLPGDRPAEVLLYLAMRHDRPDLVWNTVGKWARQEPDQAVQLLTEAATSEELGRAVRARMYDWARGAEVPLQLVVAKVCGGPMADVFDRVALTRLRNLAKRADGQVAEAVIDALADMVVRPRLTGPVLSEIVKWIEEGPEQARETGARSFTRIAALRTEAGQLRLIPMLREMPAFTDVVGRAWRGTLRTPSVRGEAVSVGVTWLDEAHRGQSDRETVHRVFAAICGTSKDIALLHELLYHWARTAPDDGADRVSYWNELMQVISRLDPLTPGLTPRIPLGPLGDGAAT